MLEPPLPSKQSTSMHRLSWVALFLAAGALASWVVIGRSAGEPARDAAPEPPAPAPVAAATAVERRSLLADSTGRSATAEVASPEPIGAKTAAGAPPAAASSSEPSARPRGSASAESRTAIERPPSMQRLARTAVAAPPPRRKRPQRADTPEAAESDTELDGMFTVPEPSERRASGDTELEGMFPRDESITVGANGAPVPD
jgi:hypothetical protein